MSDPVPALRSVMLVDDDEFLLDMYTLKFKERGITVSAYQSAETALQALREGQSPELLVTDVVMPGINGFEFLEKVRDLALANPPLTIVLSNQGQNSDIEMAKNFEAIGYIVKANAIPSEVIETCITLYQKRSK